MRINTRTTIEEVLPLLPSSFIGLIWSERRKLLLQQEEAKEAIKRNKFSSKNSFLSQKGDKFFV
jgi:hypothetical protein